ncbi:MAG: CpsD/CapB family tyrosine-protein kinase [Clostridia bacterium]|nr:CpsD/CapB family tyrosine-protein kinase [Clostridia bacterium]
MAQENKSYIPGKTGSSNRNVAFRVAEAYKMIRTNLLFTLANAKSKVVIFSSAEPSAGKSTLCSNLAIVMAQTGAKVLLIDADMRKPVQHRNFRVSKSLGLSKILGNLNTFEECVVRNVVPGLDLLPSGSIPPNPSELLGSDKMKSLLDKAEEVYDYIFMDSPPLAVVADALVLAPQSAGVVLVARQKQTTYDELEECIESVKRIDAAVLGVVVTDVHATSAGYMRYDSKYYYRSYNYEYGRRAKSDD